MSKKNPELLPKSWKVNGNIFFELFLHDLDKKNDLSRLQKITKQKNKAGRHNWAARRENKNKAFLWIIFQP